MTTSIKVPEPGLAPEAMIARALRHVFVPRLCSGHKEHVIPA